MSKISFPLSHGQSGLRSDPRKVPIRQEEQIKGILPKEEKNSKRSGAWALASLSHLFFWVVP